MRVDLFYHVEDKISAEEQNDIKNRVENLLNYLICEYGVTSIEIYGEGDDDISEDLDYDNEEELKIYQSSPQQVSTNKKLKPEDVEYMGTMGNKPIGVLKKKKGN